jgi:hypothetical protein
MNDLDRRSILPLSGKTDPPLARTQAYGGLEQVLALAAVEPRFAAALMADRTAAVRAAGIALTGAEGRALAAPDAAALERMIAGVAPTLPEPDRRAFLGLAGAALLVLATGCDPPSAPVEAAPAAPDRRDLPYQGGAKTGARPDRPDEPVRRVSFQVSEVRIQQGKLTVPVIERQLHSGLSRLSPCAERPRATGQTLPGQLHAAFRVKGTGEVALARFVGEGTVANEIGKCLATGFGRVRFPATGDAGETVFTAVVKLQVR